MASPAALLLLLAAVHVSGVLSTCSNASLVAAGLEALLAEYDRGEAPDAPATISAALDVRHAAVAERASTLRLLADLHLRWQDKRISWNATEWECDSVLVPAERLWLPDVELLNGAASAGDADGSLRARLGADSSVTWIARIDVAVPLAIDLRDWPNDKQSAVFKFGSREHTIDELELEVNDFAYATVWEAGSWEIISVRGSDETLAGGMGTRRAVTWSLALRRRAAAHALALGAVLAAAALLLVAAAVLPAPARPPLCACAAFTAAIWMISALLRLPGSATCPRAMSVMAGVCALAGVWCACSAGVARLARCAAPAPPALRTLLAAAPAWSVATSPVRHQTMSQEHPESASATWAAAAQLLDNLLRAALALVLLVLVCLTL